MTRHQPYLPPLPQTTAALIRVDTCDTRRSTPSCATARGNRAVVPPGHGGRGVPLSYRALAPGGAGFCYRICTGTSESRPTAHYSLLTANSTYTFSAKEKDSETGLSYFGSRYYSSDLSVWLSVDPMAGKYPSTSPYAYCRNNTIRLIDPNGMFDDEAKATRLRNRAARRYGEERVSKVFNNTIDGGKSEYAFSIYGKGKTKRSYSGGTNEYGGPIITCDKPDKVVFSRKDFRSYNRSSRRSTLDLDFTITAGWQVGTALKNHGKRTGLSLMVNLNSVDLIGGNCHIQSDKTSFDGYCIDQSNINSNSGIALDPLISYNYNQQVRSGEPVSSNHSISSFFMETYNSNRNHIDTANEYNGFVMSYSAAFFIGIRFNLKYR